MLTKTLLYTGVSCVTSEIIIGVLMFWVLSNFEMCFSVIEYLRQDKRHEHLFKLQARLLMRNLLNSKIPTEFLFSIVLLPNYNA